MKDDPTLLLVMLIIFVRVYDCGWLNLDDNIKVDLDFIPRKRKIAK